MKFQVTLTDNLCFEVTAKDEAEALRKALRLARAEGYIGGTENAIVERLY